MQIKTKFVSCHTADSKPVKPEVNGTVILPPLVFPGAAVRFIFTAIFEANFASVNIRFHQTVDVSLNEEKWDILNFVRPADLAIIIFTAGIELYMM